jgi:hypothetical protein
LYTRWRGGKVRIKALNFAVAEFGILFREGLQAIYLRALSSAAMIREP